MLIEGNVKEKLLIVYGTRSVLIFIYFEIICVMELELSND